MRNMFKLQSLVSLCLPVNYLKTADEATKLLFSRRPERLKPCKTENRFHSICIVFSLSECDTTVSGS